MVTGRSRSRNASRFRSYPASKTNGIAGSPGRRCPAATSRPVSSRTWTAVTDIGHLGLFVDVIVCSWSTHILTQRSPPCQVTDKIDIPLRCPVRAAYNDCTTLTGIGEPTDTAAHRTRMDISVRRRLRLAGALASVALPVYWFLDVTGVLAGSSVGYTGYDGPAMVSADGRTVTVGGFGYPCFGTVSPLAQESARQVRLSLRWTTPNKHGVCNKSMALVRAMDVHLSAPLSARTLVNGDNGRALDWFDGRRVLHPSWLPAGCALQYASPAVSSGLATGPRYLAGYVQDYQSSTTGAVLMITQILGTANTPPDPQDHPTAIRVRGHPGRADSHSITWTEDGQTIRLSIYSQGSAPGKPVTVTDLLAIAASAS